MKWFFKQINKIQVITELLSENLIFDKFTNLFLLATICLWGGVSFASKNFYVSASLLIIIWFLNGLLSRKSCGGLLFYWISVYLVSMCYFLYIAQSYSQGTGGLSSLKSLIRFEVIFIIVIVFIWVISALIAEDEAARMALIITTSATTIITTIVQLFSLYYQAPEQPDHNRLLGEAIQNIIYYLLIPFVVSGYFSFAMKELQIYAKRKHSKIVCPSENEIIQLQEKTQRFMNNFDKVFTKKE